MRLRPCAAPMNPCRACDCIPASVACTAEAESFSRVQTPCAREGGCVHTGRVVRGIFFLCVTVCVVVWLCGRCACACVCIREDVAKCVVARVQHCWTQTTIDVSARKQPKIMRARWHHILCGGSSHTVYEPWAVCTQQNHEGARVFLAGAVIHVKSRLSPLCRSPQKQVFVVEWSNVVKGARPSVSARTSFWRSPMRLANLTHPHRGKAS